MMNANDRKPIFTITSRDSGRKRDFGTGFLIHCRDESAWFLTCRHVVDEVGGPEKTLVEGEPVVDAVMPESTRVVDLAVLRVKAFSHLKPLRLLSIAEPGRKIIVEGYYEFDPKKPLYERNGITGQIEKLTYFSDGKSPHGVKIWALKIEDTDFLKGGYSGSPVIDSKTGAVVAVVSHQKGMEKGRAVSCEMLLRVWPDMPSQLKAAMAGQKKEAEKEKSFKLGPLIIKMCNRDSHAADFEDFFKRICEQQRRCRTAQFYIIHGSDDECHESLVERLKNTHIREHKDPQWRNLNLLPQHYSVPWPKRHHDFKKYKYMILNRLFDEVTQQSSSGDYKVSTFCNLPQIKEFNIVLIVHRIRAENWWKRHYNYTDVLSWYMTEYWSLPEDTYNIPLFLIFFNIIYPHTSEKHFLKRVFSRHSRIKIGVTKELKRLYSEVKEKCPCLLIEEIKSVERDEVDEWFRKYAPSLSDYDRIKEVDSLFNEREQVTMAEAEKLLKEVFDRLAKRHYERQFK